MSDFARQIARLLALLLFLLATVPLRASNGQDILVDTDWLRQHLHDDKLRIVDTRERPVYLKGHIPGAVNIPAQETFNPAPPRDRVANLHHIRQVFRRAGINSGQTVVIYGDSGYIDAGRVFWVFEVYGHKQVKFLDGGFPAWRQQQHPVSTQVPEVEPGNYIPAVEPERLTTLLDMRLALEDDSKFILDARTTEEYLGKKSKARRFGHIPKATSIPAVQNFVKRNGVQMLKPREEVARLYAAVPKDRKVYAYCNRGKESSLTYTLLRQLGYDVAHYDGSWYEWGNDENLPIVKPQP